MNFTQFAPSPYSLGTILVIIAATFLGTGFAVWQKTVSGSIASATLLVTICSILSLTGEHALITHLGLFSILGLALGGAMGLSFPCCSVKPKPATLQIIGFCLLFLHALADGHILHETHSALLLVALLVHKFMDGADIRILRGTDPAVARVASIAVIAATPLGFLLVPESVIPHTVHDTLFAAVIGFNLGSAIHLYRHAWEVSRASVPCA
jgi:hypothetical protein